MAEILKKEKKHEDVQSEAKVQDLVRGLKGIEQILQISPANKEQLAFVREFRNILNPYRAVSGSQFLNSLENYLSMNIGKGIEARKRQEKIQIDVEHISFEEIRSLISKNILSKEKLLTIAEKRLGLSKGTLRKMKKEKIHDQIEGAIQNIETLEVIKRKASE